MGMATARIEVGQPGYQLMHKVIKSYISAYPDPIRVRVGDKLTLFIREWEWPGWVWCQSESGKEGWVPLRYLEKSGSNYVACADYDATELTVHEGEQVGILHKESGWGWCRSNSGRSGWVPLENLEPLER